MNHALHALCALGLVACIAPMEVDPVEDLVTSETESDLLVSSWSAPSTFSSDATNGQIATISGRTIMVHTGPGTQLRWRERTASGGWTSPVTISGQSTSAKVSLAPFNGFLYMIRTAPSSTQLHVSRFNPSTSQWTASFQIPHTSFGGPPALAAMHSRLHLIGVNPGDKMLWHATMTVAEAFSAAAPMPGHYSNSRVAAAYANCKVYIAHRGGSTSSVVFNSFDGASWTYDQTVPGLTAYEVAIAERGGYLHLVARDASGTATVPVWWTYFDGAGWPTPVTIPGASTSYPPSLATGGPGLVASFATYHGPTGSTIGASASYTLAPPAWPPLCPI